MPSLAHLLSQLEESKRTFGPGNAARTEKLIELLGRRRFRGVDSLIRFHETLLFVRSHPQSHATFRAAEKLLSTFTKRVDELRSLGVDLTQLDYIENSGIAGTTISGRFSYDIVRFLTDRHSTSVDVDWEAS